MSNLNDQPEDPLFGEIESELNAAFEEEQGDNPNCTDVISVEHIGHDIEQFTEKQIDHHIQQELLELLIMGRFEVKYQKRLGKRTVGTGAFVHFHNRVFADGSLYLLYYSVQGSGDKLTWKLQGVFHLSEIFPYRWNE